MFKLLSPLKLWAEASWWARFRLEALSHALGIDTLTEPCFPAGRHHRPTAGDSPVDRLREWRTAPGRGRQVRAPDRQDVVQAAPLRVKAAGAGFVAPFVPMNPTVTEPDGAMVAV